MAKSFIKVFLIIAVVGWLATPAVAENSLKTGEMGLSFSVADEDFVMSGRYFLEPHLAVLGLFGFQAIGNGDNGTNFKLGAGIRQYFSITSELLPFLGANIAFVSAFDPPKDESGVELNALFGVEYFLASRFSAEASVGIEFKTITEGKDVTTFGTARSSVGVNFYFP